MLDGDEVRVKAALARKDRPDVTIPIERGAMKWSLVTLAARWGHVHILPALVDAGASLEGENFETWTPLMYAADNDDVRAIEALLSFGADPLTSDTSGEKVAVVVVVVAVV